MSHADERCNPGWMEQEREEADEKAYADYMAMQAQYDREAEEESLFLSEPDALDCPRCGGSGGGEGFNVCSRCFGSGEISPEQDFDF